MKTQSQIHPVLAGPVSEVPDHLVLLNYIGHAYVSLGDLPALEKVISESVARFNNARVYFRAACLFALAGQETKAFEWLEKAFRSGYCDIVTLLRDDDLKNIRNSDDFKKLFQQYFPEMV